MKALIVFTMAVILAGCGALTVNPVSSRKAVKEDIPPVGSMSKVDLGERMMVHKDYEVVRVVKLPLTHVSLHGLPHVMAGPYEISADNYYCGNMQSQTIGSVGRVVRTCLTQREFNEMVPNAPQPTEIIVPRPANLQRILEYTGRADNRLTFSYKEFTETVDGVFIRPAYTQDFTFDLAQGNEIGVKGARLRVMRATNTEIEYVVLKHFTTQ